MYLAMLTNVYVWGNPKVITGNIQRSIVKRVGMHATFFRKQNADFHAVYTRISWPFLTILIFYLPDK